MDNNQRFPATLQRLGVMAVPASVLGLILLIFDSLHSVQNFYHAWTFAFDYLMCLTIGCFGLMLLSNMVRAEWCRPILRIFEAGALNLAFMALCVLPIVYAAFTRHLFPWAHPSTVASDPILQSRAVWFNPLFFTIRNIVFFVVLTGIAYIIRSLALKQDLEKNVQTAKQIATMRASIAAPCFLLMVFAVTSAATDWIMSLDPHWYSTIFGFHFLIGAALCGMSFAVALATTMKLAGEGEYAQMANPKATKDWGNLMLMMTMVWAYFSISQYMIYWSGNLPLEVTFYVQRNVRTLAWFTSTLIICQFFLPFLLLLSSRLKRYARMLRNTALLIFFTRILEVAWEVIPMFHSWHGSDSGFVVQFQGGMGYLGALLFMGGIWMALFVRNIKRASLIPNLDPQILEVMEHAH